MSPDKKSGSDVLALLAEKNTQMVKLAITDLDGVLRGKVISFEKFRSVAEKGFGFCDVVFGWDAADAAYDNAAVTGWHTGYPDANAFVDRETFRKVPWENDIPFFIADFRHDTGGAKAICPRTLLVNVASQAQSEGFLPYFSQEFEWFNVVNNTDELYENKFRDLKPMTHGMFGYSLLRAGQQRDYFYSLFEQLAQFNIPLEGLHTETGPGVYEAAIAYSTVVEAADRAVLFKSSVKQLAFDAGFIATFMAKLSESLPGCSGHVHQSLWSTDGSQNLFYDEHHPRRISALMESYIAGQLATMPVLLPFYAPTVNSYKRLVEGAWAPTTLTWAFDNRTTALRVLASGENSTRLETRVVGSDANPYLAMAASLAAGLYGIRNKLKLEIPETKGSGYADKKNGVLPGSLQEATAAMKESAVARGLFGDAFIDHFASTREWEWRQYSKVVTDWELKRYLEII